MVGNANRVRYFMCSCSMELIRVELDYDFELVNISIYRQGADRSILDRLKHCWKILTTGEPYGDEVLLKPEDALKMGEFLSKAKLLHEQSE